MKLRMALLATTVLALPVAAKAQPVQGLYIGAGAGVNWMQETDDTNDPRSVVGLGLGESYELDTDLGFVGVLSLGWGFGNGLRAEVEGNFRYNEVNEVTAFGTPLTGDGGYIRSYGAMVNLLYDFSPRFLGLARFDYIRPYIGAGVGYIWLDYDGVGGFLPGGNRFVTDDTDARFAYQGIVGVTVPFTWAGVPGLSAWLEYRFLGMLDPKLNTYVQGPATGGARVAVGNLEPNYYNHSVLLGVRYAFNQPRPAAPVAPAPVAVAPAPAPARTYLVFFDWDRADLTERARQIIGEAAQNSTRVPVTRLEVAGHADRSGTPQYNERLSQRRAEAVAAELVRQGVPREAIVVTAFGESRPLVPTADGVREPQNRRVEIVLR